MESIERSFRVGSGPYVECNCGKVYWDNYNNAYDWESGELERLSANPNAVPCDFAPSRLILLGAAYCDACDCWHGVGVKVANWLDENKIEIANYFKLERERIIAAGDSIPVIS